MDQFNTYINELKPKVQQYIKNNMGDTKVVRSTSSSSMPHFVAFTNKDKTKPVQQGFYPGTIVGKGKQAVSALIRPMNNVSDFVDYKSGSWGVDKDALTTHVNNTLVQRNPQYRQNEKNIIPTIDMSSTPNAQFTGAQPSSQIDRERIAGYLPKALIYTNFPTIGGHKVRSHINQKWGYALSNNLNAASHEFFAHPMNYTNWRGQDADARANKQFSVPWIKSDKYNSQANQFGAGASDMKGLYAAFNNNDYGHDPKKAYQWFINTNGKYPYDNNITYAQNMNRKAAFQYTYRSQILPMKQKLNSLTPEQQKKYWNSLNPFYKQVVKNNGVTPQPNYNGTMVS